MPRQIESVARFHLQIRDVSGLSLRAGAMAEDLAVGQQHGWNREWAHRSRDGCAGGGKSRLVSLWLRSRMVGHSETPAPLCLCESSSEDFLAGPLATSGEFRRMDGMVRE